MDSLGLLLPKVWQQAVQLPQHIPCSQQHPCGAGKRGGDPKVGYKKSQPLQTSPITKARAAPGMLYPHESCSIPVLDGDSSQELGHSGTWAGYIALCLGFPSCQSSSPKLWQNYTGIFSCCLWKLIVPMALLS